MWQPADRIWGHSHPVRDHFWVCPPAPTDVAVVFRARPEAIWNSSGGAFIRDYSADGIGMVSAYVRHNVPDPLTFFVRVATGPGSPGHVYSAGIDVPPNVWTKISADVSPDSPQLLSSEGSNWNSVFPAARHLQIGVVTPLGYGGIDTAYTFDVDKVTLSTPEPTAAALAAVGFVAMAFSTRRQNRRGCS